MAKQKSRKASSRPARVTRVAKGKQAKRATGAVARRASKAAPARAVTRVAAPKPRRSEKPLAPPPKTPPASLPRDPKGGRSQFYQDPAIDQLWAVVTALTAEVSVAFDRLDTVERLLERDGRVTRAAIEAWRPDDDAHAERAQRREALIQRVFQVLSQYR